MTDQEILKLRDPKNKVYKSLTEFKNPKGMIEYEDYYGQNILHEYAAEDMLITESRLMVYSGMVEDNTGNIIITIGNKFPLVYNENSKEYTVDPEFRSIRVDLLNCNYGQYSEDIFTEKQKQEFIEIMNNNWNRFRESTISSNNSINLDNIIPKNCPDFSSLSVKD
jgi:hypothetical protein